MPQVTLLQLGTSQNEQDAYAFDHRQSHDVVQAALATPPSAAYFLDPLQDNKKWMLDHAISSIDQLALQGLAEPFAAPDLTDTTLQSPTLRQWWVWQNHMQGLASFAALPTGSQPATSVPRP